MGHPDYILMGWRKRYPLFAIDGGMYACDGSGLCGKCSTPFFLFRHGYYRVKGSTPRILISRVGYLVSLYRTGNMMFNMKLPPWFVAGAHLASFGRR